MLINNASIQIPVAFAGQCNHGEERLVVTKMPLSDVFFYHRDLPVTLALLELMDLLDPE